MKILVTGATGLVGRRLVADRIKHGDDLLVISRDATRARATLGDHGGRMEIIEANPMNTGDWQHAVEGCRAVVHLAGAGVADRRWTKAYKKMLVDSRVESTKHVSEAIRNASDPPGVLVNASAVGYYGDCGDSAVDETSPVGDDFLASLSTQWEAQARSCESASTRVVLLRIGVVLDERGGVLGKMLPLFRFMLGGPLGSGRQYFPWVHWRDLVGLIDLALGDETLSGPVNAVAPEAVTNRQFTRALGRVVGRPAVMPTPAAVLRIVIGELGKYAVMSQRVVPEKARRHGYQFVFPQLEAALENLVRPST